MRGGIRDGHDGAPGPRVSQYLGEVNAHSLGVMTVSQCRYRNPQTLLALAAGRLALTDAPARILQIAQIGVPRPETLLHLHAGERPNQRTESKSVRCEKPCQRALSCR